MISPNRLLLTNSFGVLKKDIDSISEKYDFVILFGVDKTLVSMVKLEKSDTMDGKRLCSKLELIKFAELKLEIRVFSACKAGLENHQKVLVGMV